MSISVDLNITLINVPLPRVLTSTLLQGNVAGMTYFIENLICILSIFYSCGFFFFSCVLFRFIFHYPHKSSRLDPGFLAFAD